MVQPGLRARGAAVTSELGESKENWLVAVSTRVRVGNEFASISLAESFLKAAFGQR